MIWRGLLIGEDELEAKKSRVLWLKEGSKCTKFFQRVANSNRRNNSIELLVNGSVSSNQTKIRDHIVYFYYDLFTEQFNWQPKFDGLDFYSIMRLLLG